ncbi:lateral signaling target protein 2 homolog [Drosophila ficusphila]|uniref:lateral signaling target protein 2 homolog n=1 Tax=Drosophila ficusphila TaxID=30025 RepID=UPI0007E85050|nr:lateral signaling target protein 2 homolog [Drosophila ficusphila]
MRAVCVLSLIACLGITPISTKSLDENETTDEVKALNKTERARMFKELKLLQKLANETYYSTDPTTKETDLTKDPTAEETEDPTGEETGNELENHNHEGHEHVHHEHGDHEHEDHNHGVHEHGNKVNVELKPGQHIVEENGEFFIVEDDEDEDEATVDKPTEVIPVNFLKYPKHEPDFKPYPRFAILRNGFVLHNSLVHDF